MLQPIYISQLWRTKVLDQDKYNAKRVADFTSKKFGMNGTELDSNYTGYLGENIIRRSLGFDPCELIVRGGDGGIDIHWQGLSIDVKCKLCNMEELKPGFKFAVSPKAPGTRTSDVLLLTVYNSNYNCLYILGAINTKEVDKIPVTKLQRKDGTVKDVQDIDVINKVKVFNKTEGSLSSGNLFNFLLSVKEGN